MTGTKILLVEDDFLNRRLAKKILIAYGYQVLEAKHAQEALDTLKNESVDLIILDIHLGEQALNGISLGHEIKHTYQFPLIYLTAYETPEIIAQAMATTPYSYLTKPFKHIDLINAVQIALTQAAKTAVKKVFLQVKDGSFNLSLHIDEIGHIESDGNYLLLHAGAKIYRYRSTISKILQSLPSSFVQTHRAFIININKVEKFSSKSIIINQKEIPISANYKGYLPFKSILKTR